MRIDLVGIRKRKADLVSGLQPSVELPTHAATMQLEASEGRRAGLERSPKNGAAAVAESTVIPSLQNPFTVGKSSDCIPWRPPNEPQTHG